MREKFSLIFDLSETVSTKRYAEPQKYKRKGKKRNNENV